MSYRILPHPSDVGFEARADDFVVLLDRAVRALSDIETGGQIPDAIDTRPIPEADPEETPEERVVSVLEHCLFLLDTEDWLVTGVDPSGERLLGAQLTPDARAAGVHVKAITWHQLAVAHVPGVGWSAVVFVDI